MGICGSKSSGKKLHYIPSHQKLVYYASVNINIHMKDTPHYEAHTVQYKVDLDAPETVLSKQVFTQDGCFYVSTCVLPSKDIMSKTPTLCQDSSLLYSNETMVFAGLYDGHGKYGRDISRLVKGFMEEQVEAGIQPNLAYFEQAMNECQAQILANEDLDSSLSGTTALHACVSNGKLYISNLGDSFAVIGTQAAKQSPYEMPDFPLSKGLSVFYKTRRIPECQLHTLPATVRHMPILDSELDRIEQAGGRVKRLCKGGKPIGAYRVWCADSKQPGLSMSRSLGDKVAATIGVIQTPTVYEYKIDKSEDEFVVLATSGLWQVLEPVQVIKFVETYRYYSNIRQGPPGNEVRASNSCIAYLLCEEARLRWLALVAEEPIHISDISCTVIEFNRNNRRAKNFKQKVLIKRNQVGIRRAMSAAMQVGPVMGFYAGSVLADSEVEDIES